MDNITEYYKKSRPEMLSYIPSDLNVVLDVGCGCGGFGSLIKKQREVKVWGVEYEKIAAEAASMVLDKVINLSIENAFVELPLNYFDCVVFNDSLEHMVDPFYILNTIKPYIKKSGVIVASIPNIRHWPEFVDYVIHGQWRYCDQGILDRTHLRFFTKKSIKDTFINCGYTISCIEGINPYYSRAQNLLNLLSLGTLDDTRYLQFSIVASPNIEQA